MAKKAPKRRTGSARQQAQPPQPPAHLPPGDACVDLDAIIGHGRAIETLRSACTSGRVHHAWVFSGPMGVGKRTAAEAFAATLMTTRPADADPEYDLLGNPIPPSDAMDDEARSLLRRRAHPDFHLITKELAAFSADDATRRSKQRTIPINVIREFLIEPAYLAPTLPAADEHTGIRKAFIIDEAELLRAGDNAAQNALLKTLEEPPEGTLIILVTAREDALLPTIRSRCQRVVFGSLDDAAMTRWLDATPEAADASESDREALLHFAAGSPGRFLLGLRTGIAGWSARLGPALTRLDRGEPVPGLHSELKACCSEWAESWVKGNPLGSKEAANHAAVEHMLALLSARYRAALHTNAHIGPKGDRAAMETSCAHPLAALDAIAHARAHARANVNLDFVFADLAMTLAQQP